MCNRMFETKISSSQKKEAVNTGGSHTAQSLAAAAACALALLVVVLMMRTGEFDVCEQPYAQDETQATARSAGARLVDQALNVIARRHQLNTQHAPGKPLHSTASCGPVCCVGSSGRTARCLMVGRPCGQLKGASSCAKRASMRPCCCRVRGLPIMMDVRQARLARTSRTLHDQSTSVALRLPGGPALIA